MKFLLVILVLLLVSCNPKRAMNKVECRDNVGNIILSGKYPYADFEENGTLAIKKDGVGTIKVKGTCTVEPYYEQK